MSSDTNHMDAGAPGREESWAIRAEGLSKWYKLYEKRGHRLLESVNIFSKRKYHTKFYALKDVSFKIGKGETVGIIGPNGSGKSTLLGMVSGIIHPGSGKVEVKGRVASLLELGAGFNPELTGMENILFGGNMRGLSETELRTRMDAIVRFADIGEYIHQPVKSYSSGMFVRLAFALNIHLEPEILIIDEAMAVGDYDFQSKCMTAIRMIMSKGTTVLLVSHDMSSIRSLCQRVMYVNGGRLVEFGDPQTVTFRYLDDMQNNLKRFRGLNYLSAQGMHASAANAEAHRQAAPAENPAEAPLEDPFVVSEEFERQAAAFRRGSGKARVTYMDLTNVNGVPIRQVGFKQEVVFNIHCLSHHDRYGVISFSILDHNKNVLTSSNFYLDHSKTLIMKEGGRYIVGYHMSLPLGEGFYSCECQIWSSTSEDEQMAELMDSVTDALTFQVVSEPGKKIWAKLHLDYNVTIKELPVS